MIARRAVPVAIVALLAAASPVHAQDSTAAVAQNLVGIGVNMPGGGGLTPSFQLGREWRAPASRFAARLSLDYNTTESSRAVYPFYFTDGSAGESRLRTRDVTLGVATTFVLAKGRIQPYLLTGGLVGYQEARTRYEANPDMPTVGGALNQSFGTRRDDAWFGLQAGAGVSVRVRGATLFTEYRRFQALDGGNAFRYREALPRPLTFGFRF